MAETNENPLAETVKEPAVVTGKSSPAKTRKASTGGTRKAAVIETRKESAPESIENSFPETSAEPILETGREPIPETKEDSAIEESNVDPVAGIVEAALAGDFEVLEELGNEGVKAAESVARSYSGSFQMFATETADYAKQCFENRAAFAGALLGAKSFESAVQLQTSYAKSAYASFLAHLMKMNGLYWNLLGEASKPIQKVTAR
ncbi:MAG TPA: phasin family protein [Methylocella sp.]|nr:phasin family protein [Methylocella sp.]